MATTPTPKKLTKKDKFAMLKAIPAVAENALLVEFIDNEIALLERKSTTKDGEKKQTAQQQENEAIKGEILNYMEMGSHYTISNLMTNVPNLPADMSHHRMVSLTSQLVKAEALVRSKGKGGVTLFSLSE